MGLALLLASVFACGCGHSSSKAPDGIAVTWESTPKPPRVGPNTFTVILTGSKGQRLAGAKVALECDMSHPGMSPVFGTAAETAPGQYIGTLDLNMLGDWTVVFHITLPDGRSFDRPVNIGPIQAT
jgi:hypothetical protein